MFAVFCTDIANNRISTEIGYRLSTLKVLQGVTWTKNDWIGHAPSYLCAKRTVKEENRVRMRQPLPIKCVSFSFNLPMFPCCSLLLWSVINSSYFCRQKCAMKRRTDKGVLNTNKTELQTKQQKIWDILSLRIQIGQSWGTKYSTLPRPATRHSGNRAGTPIGCTTVMCAGCLISASAPCSTTVDTGVLPFAQIGHKCYYKREDVERLLQTKSEKSKNG